MMNSNEKRLSFFQMVASVLASFFGVQSSKNRSRDFKLGRARDFILVGVLMTLVWYGVVYAVVSFILSGR